MKTRLFVWFSIWVFGCNVYGQESGLLVESSAEFLNFSLLRQQDHIYFGEAGPNDLYEHLKEICLGEQTTLSLGGSYRSQVEGFINEQFNSAVDQDDLWHLNRLMAHAHFKIDKRFELFAELNSSFITSKDNLAPVDRDELAINQLFVSYWIDPQWNLLVGRQNMRMGSGRLVDIREGPNVRLSFDMAQLKFKDENTEITAFYAIPVRPAAGIFDNDALNTTETLAGIYWTQNWSENNNTDLYAFYKQEEQKTWNSGTADDNRLSLGVRHFGNWNRLRYNNEFVIQTGDFGTQNIFAWTASFNIEHPVKVLGIEGTLGLKTEAISGDTSTTDNRLGTFDGLYPRGAYFGRVARIGPSNLIDFHPYCNTEIGPVALSLDYVAFWRFSKEDGLYGPPLTLDYPDVNDSRFIGHQIGTIAGLEINRHIAFELETNLIFPGDFLKNSGLNDTLFHAVFTTEIKF
ncbi:alginate export family protein [Gilvibacter sp.]|uniref:alginate export family protein n=1 Tax=Gilvibacter sp. TaxID=2729997 RepID=UPI0025BC3E4E|nr:alginate export family protein [Gilvibacter sp.]NQX77954.1 alginate export family protein [Gilvibacter sp.]